MPIYEYRCNSCGTDFERLLKRTDEKVACECGSDKVTRRLSVFAAHVTAGSSSKSSSVPGPACETCNLAGGGCELA